jgi:hypothetical protein
MSRDAGHPASPSCDRSIASANANTTDVRFNGSRRRCLTGRMRREHDPPRRGKSALCRRRERGGSEMRSFATT